MRGGKALGLTLSSAQAKYCAAKGLKVLLQDWKTVPPFTLGVFNGIISIGSFEHFCSIDEYIQGKKDSIYRDFFAFCARALPVGGRLFLQTMTWGKVVPDPKTVSLTALEGTPERILARLAKFYPGIRSGLSVRPGRSMQRKTTLPPVRAAQEGDVRPCARSAGGASI